MEHLKLFQNEQSAAFMGLSSVTVVFDFPGPLDEDHVRNRVISTLRQQPCLAGRLVSNQGEIEIVFKNIDFECETKVLSAMHFKAIDSTTELYENARCLRDIASFFTPAIVPNGSSALDKNEPLFRVTLIRLKAPEGSNPMGTVVVVSMSHILGDGFTFFRVVNSLFPDSCTEHPVNRLEFTRDLHFRTRVVDFLGEATVNFHWHWSSVLGVLVNRWTNGKRCCAIFRLSTAHILKRKLEFRRHVSGSYISSNDVLVSALAHDILNSSFVNLVINLRPHIYDGAPDSLRNSAMGNYFGALVLSSQDVENPASVRNAVERYLSTRGQTGTNRVAEYDLPTAYDRLRMRGTLLVSNWISLGMVWPTLPDNNGRMMKCESMLPLMFRNVTAGHNAIVFRMRPDEEDISVAFLSHREFIEKFQQHPIVADTICPPSEV